MYRRWSVFMSLIVLWLSVQVSAKEYIVKIKKNANFHKALSSLQTENATKIKSIHQIGRLAKVSILTHSGKATAHQLSLLLANKNIEYIVENIKLYSLEKPSDSQFSDQWALEKINVLSAWGLTKGSNNVVVAVIDTGADPKHEDLAANIWVNQKEIANNEKDDDGNGFVDDINGWDFHENDNSPNDETSSVNPGHGTHCSGVIGAVGNNSLGISGINQRVSIMPIRFLGADGSGDLFSSTKAIDYATANGAHIISASWGVQSTKAMVQPIIDAIERANQEGILFVAAAGNDGSSNDSTPNYPANAGSSNVINVAASGPNDKKPNWSNFGRLTVDLASPGEDIVSTLPENKYGKLSGTSMATPLVAGLAALLKSQDSTLTPRQLKAILQSTGTEVEIETACKCRIDAAAATKAVAIKALTVLPASGHLDLGETITFDAWGGVAPYTFTSSDPEVATVTAEGKLTAVKKGETKVSVRDSRGSLATSLNILIGQKPSETKDGCPFSDPMTCMFMCLIMPDAPWCKNSEGMTEKTIEKESTGNVYKAIFSEQVKFH
jgi:thermitase